VPSLSGAGENRDSDAKVFWFFSSEKNCFLPFYAKRGNTSFRLNNCSARTGRYWLTVSALRAVCRVTTTDRSGA
jgi:hypothetical protein